MKDEIKKDTTVSLENDDTKPDLSRREFVSKSTGTIAAASAMAAGAGAALVSKEASAAWPKPADVSIPSDLLPVENADDSNG
jgi:nitrous oxide reductase